MQGILPCADAIVKPAGDGLLRARGVPGAAGEVGSSPQARPIREEMPEFQA
jgi:hypothetical protein